MKNEKIIINNKSSEPLFYLYDDVFRLMDEYHETDEHDRFTFETMDSNAETFKLKRISVEFKPNKKSLTINLTDYDS